MIYEHEIPKGARLYFGQSAKLKRDIERLASDLLYKEGFEEIDTPLFSYHQHHYLEDEKELITLHDEQNRRLSLRADSTIDVVRLITNRLGRSTEHKKWFYIQPVYRYPTYEYNQIGAEVLENAEVGQMLRIVLEFFSRIGLRPTLQISNIQIPKILAKEYNISLDVLKHMDIDRLLESEQEWMVRLLHLHSADQIGELLGLVPQIIEEELVKIKELSDFVHYDNLIIAPLYYANMRYYQDLFFRFFQNNATLAMGGEYEAAGIKASGFSIYTDFVINRLKGE